MAVKRIISGGQTGADRGGLDAAIELGIPHGGWCPAGRRAEDGRVPDCYALLETADGGYPTRTRRNVAEADGTVVFTYGAPSGGSLLTLRFALDSRVACLAVDPRRGDAAAVVRGWLRVRKIKTLNVAGSRESTAPGIQALVRCVLVTALRSAKAA